MAKTYLTHDQTMALLPVFCSDPTKLQEFLDYLATADDDSVVAWLDLLLDPTITLTTKQTAWKRRNAPSDGAAAEHFKALMDRAPDPTFRKMDDTPGSDVDTAAQRLEHATRALAQAQAEHEAAQTAYKAAVAQRKADKMTGMYRDVGLGSDRPSSKSGSVFANFGLKDG